MHPLEDKLLKLATKVPEKHLSAFKATVMEIQAFHEEGFVLPEEKIPEGGVPTLSPINDQGKTPLMIAAGNGSAPYIDVLLDCGVDPCIEVKGASALSHASMMASVSSSDVEIESLNKIQQAYLKRFNMFDAAGNYTSLRAILNTTSICYLPVDIFMHGLKLGMKDPQLASYKDKIFYGLKILAKLKQGRDVLESFVLNEFESINDLTFLKKAWEELKGSQRIKEMFKPNLLQIAFSLGSSPWDKLVRGLDRLYEQKTRPQQNEIPRIAPRPEREAAGQRNQI